MDQFDSDALPQGKEEAIGVHVFHWYRSGSRCDHCNALMNSRAAQVKPCPMRELTEAEVNARLDPPAWTKKAGAKATAKKRTS